jgi:hypothetical protein
MTKDEQRKLLTNFINDVRVTLLARSERWPDNWDGFELRWLVEEAFKFESPGKVKKRFKVFENEYIVRNLY